MNYTTISTILGAIYKEVQHIRMNWNVAPSRILIVGMPGFVGHAITQLPFASYAKERDPHFSSIYGIPCEERSTTLDMPRGVYVEIEAQRAIPILSRVF